jgi:hypothetical protein
MSALVTSDHEINYRTILLSRPQARRSNTQ